MQSKRIAAIVVASCLVAMGCRKTKVEGTGGNASTSSTHGVTASSAASTTSTAAGGACDMIGKCNGDGMSPGSGCIECSILGTAATATDGGTCRSQYLAVYGSDGMCTGGQPAACAFRTCSMKCDPTNAFTTQAAWDCLCTNDKMGASSTCSMTQTDTSTCEGKLFLDHAAVTALSALYGCVLNQVCKQSCAAPGG